MAVIQLTFFTTTDANAGVVMIDYINIKPNDVIRSIDYRKLNSAFDTDGIR